MELADFEFLKCRFLCCVNWDLNFRNDGPGDGVSSLIQPWMVRLSGGVLGVWGVVKSGLI